MSIYSNKLYGNFFLQSFCTEILFFLSYSSNRHDTYYSIVSISNNTTNNLLYKNFHEY